MIKFCQKNPFLTNKQDISRLKYFKRNFFLFTTALIFVFAITLVPKNVFAKDITLSASTVDVEVGKTIEVQVKINTDGEKVGAVGFGIDFSTENLEGLTPNQTGSIFPMCATLSATKYECGATGQNGFSGEGLITTLTYKGRAAGPVTISLKNFEARFGPSGSEVAGFSTNSIDLTVWGEGQAPVKTTPKATTPTSSNTSSSNITEEAAPTALPSSEKQQAQVSDGSSVTGSTPSVPGTIGSQPEEPLTAATVSDPTIKGLFSSNNKIYLSIFPSLMLLALAVFLGTRLYFTEKKRHIEIERLFDNQLGMLSALESKIDLAGEKGGDGKEKLLQEFEQAKSEIKAIEDQPKEPPKPENIGPAPQAG